MYPREVRLGIVLYGGVSLAIYENGVAQELYRAVRGEGVYALLKDLIQTDIVVDIISGTSAGGVNGILFSYALANNRDFRSVARLWREHGDISKLLRREGDPQTLSLLDSENYYQPRLAEALRGMTGVLEQPGSLPSETTELDLFVTGSDFNGRIQTVYDDLGHAIDVKDHRALFKLAYRKGRKNDFEAGSEGDLAHLARLTSCFPVAFAPVVVDSAAERLRRWGKLERDAVFLDGGILGNKPFSYTIDTIQRRTADRDVERILFYVEPDPEQFGRSRPVEAPSVARSATGALVGIPGYESISDDLRSIASLNTQIAHFQELLACLPPPGNESSADALDQVAVACDATTPEWRFYFTSRIMQLRGRATAGILNHGSEREFFSGAAERRAGRILVNSFSLLDGSPSQSLDRYDVYFRRRRLTHLARFISALLDGKAPAPDGDAGVQHLRLWRRFNHFIKLSEVLESAMERLLDYSHFDWRALAHRFQCEDGSPREPGEDELRSVCSEFWGEAARMLSRLLDTEGIYWPVEDSQSARVAFHKTLMARLHSLPEVEPSGNLLQALDLELVQSVREFADLVPLSPVPRELCRFLEIDRFLFPLELISGVRARDTLRVVRISPADAQREHSARPVEKKVCGKALGDFGGFFKMPWRSNDILWGRLDAVCQIMECLLERGRARKIGAEEKHSLQARVAQLLPNSNPATQTAIAQDLLSLPTMDDERFQNLLNHVIRAAQDEIIASEWKTVLGDSLAQENEWAHHRVAIGNRIPETGYSQERLSWKAAASKPDVLIAALAARAIAEDHLVDFDATDVAGRRLLDEIPAPVLLEIGALAAMRLGWSLVASLPPSARPWIEKRRSYRMVFGVILPALYRYARFQRTAPEWRVTTTTVLLTLGLAGLSLSVPLFAVQRMHLALGAAVYAFMILGSLAAIALARFFAR
ncbi:MAG: patatin-like protein [Bryobacterales bacterium]|nr:patatin-like protein [Bryobacterales bacterium]